MVVRVILVNIFVIIVADVMFQLLAAKVVNKREPLNIEWKSVTADVSQALTSKAVSEVQKRKAEEKEVTADTFHALTSRVVSEEQSRKA